MKKIICTLFFMICFGFSQQIHSSILNEYTSAHSNALGKSGISKEGILSSIGLNPANVNATDSLYFYFFHKVNFANNQFSFFSFAFPLFNQHFGVSLAVDYPIRIDYINDFGETSFAGSISEYIVYLHWGNKHKFQYPAKWFFFFLPDKIEYGLSAKIFHSKLLEYKSTSFSSDIGFTLRKNVSFLKINPYSKFYNITVSFSILNLGSKIKYHSIAYNQPITFITSLEYVLLNMKNHRLDFSFSSTKTIGIEPYFGLGMEYTLFSIIHLKLGYTFNDPLRSFSFGIQLEHTFQRQYTVYLDYTVYPLANVGLEHNVGAHFQYSFNAIPMMQKKLPKDKKAEEIEIPHKVIKIIQKCIWIYENTYEKFPETLKILNPCLEENGTNAISATIAKNIVYNKKTGEVKKKKW